MDKDVNKHEREKNITWFFDLALMLKLVDGGLEILVAILSLVTSPKLVIRMATFITGGELAQGPSDPVASLLRNAAHSFAIHTHYLFAIYLVLHGGVKVLLVLGILAGKKIAYPLFMGALALFGTYEAYRGFVDHNIFLQILAVLDLSILLLTSYEYRRRYPKQPAHPVALGT
jgi:uncharacterized membrane protein